jgi:hypothetical protein
VFGLLLFDAMLLMSEEGTGMPCCCCRYSCTWSCSADARDSAFVFVR